MRPVLKFHSSMTPHDPPSLNCHPLFLCFAPHILSEYGAVNILCVFTFPLAHLLLLFCLTHDTKEPKHTHTTWNHAVILRPQLLGEEVSSAIKRAYPAGDQRAHNPITHPCCSLDPHYHLPWRGLLGQMIGTPHLLNSPTHCSRLPRHIS